MSYLILPGDVLARLYDQPIALNRSHSGLSRIVAAWYARDGDRPFDMLAGRTGGKSGSFPMTRSVTHEMGFAHRTPFGGVEWTDLPEWARSNNPAYSVLAISLNTGSTSSSQVALTQQGSGWAGAQIYEGNGSSNVIRGGTTRDTTSAGSTGVAVPIGRRYCAVAVDQSTSIQCAVNGQLDTAGSPSGSYNATQSRLTSGDTTRPVWLMLCWRRALSQGEMVEYSARPDQLFKREPEVSYFLFQAASGGGPTDVPASDPPTVSIDDVAAVAVAPAVTDTPTVGISDSAAIAVAQDRSDDATVGITDEAAFAVNVPVSDTPTVSISDSAALVPAVAASDPPTVSVDDTAAVAVSFAVSDDVTVSVDDSASLETPGLESKSGSDAITVSLDDATSALAAVLSRTDDVTTGVDDVAAVAVAQARSDDVSVSISDSATVAEFVSVAVTDSVSVSITDAKDALAAFLAVADESTIAITDDVGGIAVPFALTDTVGVSVGDVSSLYTGDVLVAARSRSATIPREPRSLTVPRARRSFDA